VKRQERKRTTFAAERKKDLKWMAAGERTQGYRKITKELLNEEVKRKKAEDLAWA
jgi:hypothetical protein